MIKQRTCIENSIIDKFDNMFCVKSKNLIELEVLSEDEDSLGFVKDIVIDINLGSVIGFILTQGIFEDISSGRNILLLNKSMIFEKDKIIISTTLKNEYLKNRKDYKKFLGLL